MKQASVHSQRRFKKIWLMSLFSLSLLLMIIGNLTRLTGSGLSMVNWEPIMGSIPPLNESQWQEDFQQYQEYPQYRIKNQAMTLSEFKFIFYFEYIHRILGRLVGLVALLPFLWLAAASRHIKGKELLQLGILPVLVGMQGFVGWYMVKSGLINVPEVSHFRLALHLFLALFFISYVFVLFLKYHYIKLAEPLAKHDPASYVSADMLAVLSKPALLFSWVFLALQTLYGVFMAGLRAGRVSADYPTMFGQFFPKEQFIGLADAKFGLLQFMFSHAVFIHFIHRHLGIITALIILFFVLSSLIKIYGWQQNQQNQHKPACEGRASMKVKVKTLYTAFFLLGAAVLLQPLVGILAILWHVPVSLAFVHFLLAIILLHLLLFVTWIQAK